MTLRAIAARIIRHAITIVANLAPKTNAAVVAGAPAEGNATEVLNALAKHYDGHVYEFTDGRVSQTGRHPSSIARLKKNSAMAVWVFSRAEVVFYTHGLYSGARARRGQTVINLWHGDGPKRNPADGARVHIAADYTVSGAKVFGELKGADFGQDAAQILTTGNPRIDQFSMSPTDEQLRALGIDPARPYVLWMPTYRKGRGKGVAGDWVDSAEDPGMLTTAVAPLIDALLAQGMQFVVKPHPSDALNRETVGATLIDDGALAQCGLTLYNVIGASAGLVTDYSSVWVDYLTLDRPIGFLAPDRAAYMRDRGLSPRDVFDWIPGPLIQTTTDARHFVADVAGGGSRTRHLRERSIEHFGVHSPTSSAATHLLRELERRGCFRRPLRHPARAGAQHARTEESNGERGGNHS